jgi:hypothetical protein
MSEPLVVSIPHRLGKDEALRRLKTGLAQVGTSFGHLFSVREQTWTGDHLRFQVSALGQERREHGHRLRVEDFMPDQIAPEYKEADRRTGPNQENTERARAGVTGHNVRYVLSFGLLAVIIAFAILYLIYFH